MIFTFLVSLMIPFAFVSMVTNSNAHLAYEMINIITIPYKIAKQVMKVKSHAVSTVNGTLTSYHLSDKYPVPPEAANHADCNGPPTMFDRKVFSRWRLK